jgi:hypothetical protein
MMPGCAAWNETKTGVTSGAIPAMEVTRSSPDTVLTWPRMRPASWLN